MENSIRLINNDEIAAVSGGYIGIILNSAAVIATLITFCTKSIRGVIINGLITSGLLISAFIYEYYFTENKDKKTV